MAGETVLIVDDSIEIVDFVCDMILKPNGYQVLVARDGAIGLKLVLDQPPDLILLDYNLPKTGGREMLAAVRAQDIKVPVIIMTSNGFEMLAGEAFRMGVKDCVTKPFEVTKMLEAIERALAESRLRQERDEFAQRLMTVNQQLQKHSKELNTLFGIGKSVTSLLDQDKLLTRLVEAAIYLTDAEEGALLLVDQETNELYMVAARGIDERVARSFRLKVEDSLAGEVITTGQPLILSGKDKTKIKTSYLVRSLMYVPLKIKGRIGGVFSVNNRQQRRDFTNHDLRLFSALADYAALSLENVRLFNHAESERIKLANILGEIEEPVVVVAGPDNKIVMANPAFHHIFTSGIGTFEGHPVAEVLHNQSLLDFIASMPTMGNGFKGEISIHDGRTFCATFFPIAAVGRAIIMQDITPLRELDHLKSEFMSIVSHELQAPLASMKEHAQLLNRAGELNTQQKLLVDRIGQGMDNIATLIDGVLDLDAIEAGLDSNMTTVDLGQVVTAVVADFQGRARSKGQHLICRTTLTQPALVVGNELRLKQAIHNLIDNAIQCTPENGESSIIVWREGQQVVFKLEAGGPRIPPADLPFIFDRFFISKDKDRFATKRTGLGLAISKAIVETLGGHIWAENQQDQGPIFVFTLPLASPDEANLESSSPLPLEALATL